ncbi:MAG: hypothetical protein RL261_227 [Pseudomonadota bacterium]|jgi:metabolite-proton symporter
MSTAAPTANPTRRVLFASLIGTTIEFFDFYIFATAAVLVFPHLFFPQSDPTSAVLQSFATFALAFFARPVGSALFGHFGDRIGRKATLVAALLTMGVSTVAIGLLPTYATIGIAAPLLLAFFRFGQGIGLGGEWGGAVLLAVENAPPGKRGWYGMFPQFGAPIGFVCSNGVFLLLTALLDDQQFLAWGWRIPFVASAVLVLVGLWVRLRLTETPDFERTLARNERVQIPIIDVFRRYPRELVLGLLAATSAFLLFYILTVFTLSWGTSKLGYSRQEFLELQMLAVMLFALAIPLSAWYTDRVSAHRVLAGAQVVIIGFALAFAPLFGSGTTAGIASSLVFGFVAMGLVYGPLGSAMGRLFPTSVRYTGTSLAFNGAGILGASVAPYAATWLASHYGLWAVGAYIAGTASLSLLAWLALGHRPD